MTLDLAYTERPDGSTAPRAVPFRVLGTCTGAQKLLQKAIILMLTGPPEPGRFAGGGLAAAIAGFNMIDADAMRGRLQMAINDAKAAIMAAQEQEPGLGPADRLQELELAAMTAVDRDSLALTIDIVTEAGETLRSELQL